MRTGPFRLARLAGGALPSGRRARQRCGQGETVRVRETPDDADALLPLRTG